MYIDLNIYACTLLVFLIRRQLYASSSIGSRCSVRGLTLGLILNTRLTHVASDQSMVESHHLELLLNKLPRRNSATAWNH